MKNMRTSPLFAALALVLALGALSSCVSLPEGAGPQRARLSKVEPMHWRIEAPGSTVDIFGTIHLGLPGYPGIPLRVTEAFDSADYLYGELSSTDYQSAQMVVLDLMKASLLPKDQGLDGLVSAEDKADLVSLFGAAQYSALARFKPWVMNLALVQTIYAKLGLDSAKGLDIQLYARAKDREVLGLDLLQDQVAIIGAGTVSEQAASLSDSLGRYRSGELEKLCQDLVKAYGEDDEAGMVALLAKSEEEEAVGPEGASYAEVFTKRNRSWAGKIAAMLKEGGSHFIFAGAGHFAGKDSVFDILSEQGILAPAGH